MFVIKAKALTLKIDASFFILAAVCVALGFREFFFISLTSLTVHELCHLAAAARFGLRPSAIQLTCVGQIATIDGLDNLRASRRIFLFLAGPCSNFLLAALFLVFSGNPAWFGINLLLGIFNLLPIYPLDGGRILACALAHFRGILPANGSLLRIGGFFSGLIIFAGVLQTVMFPFNISLICVGFYLRLLSREEYCMKIFEFYRDVFSGARGRDDRPVKLVPVRASAKKKSLLRLMNKDYYFVFRVYSEDSCVEIPETALIQSVMDAGLD